MNLETKIEGYLFLRGGEMSKKELCAFFSITVEELEAALTALSAFYVDRGICLVVGPDSVALATSKDFAELATSIRKEELSKELSKPSLEVLSIVLYKNTVTRAEIDYIRGVNSSYILRNLEMRGLVTKKIKEGYERIYAYTPSLDLLTYMGVEQAHLLPEYNNIHAKLSKTIEEMAAIQADAEKQ